MSCPECGEELWKLTMAGAACGFCNKEVTIAEHPECFDVVDTLENRVNVIEAQIRFLFELEQRRRDARKAKKQAKRQERMSDAIATDHETGEE